MPHAYYAPIFQSSDQYAVLFFVRQSAVMPIASCWATCSGSLLVCSHTHWPHNAASADVTIAATDSYATSLEQVTSIALNVLLPAPA